MAPTVAPGKKASWKDLVNGGVLQMLEAATLGMPFEVWKTRMGRFRNESTVLAFKNVYKSRGGGLKGVGAFWNGFAPKMVESASKGAVLLVSKEAINNGCRSMGLGPQLSAFLSGAGGGVCQTVVMGPCTFLVTAVVTSSAESQMSVTKAIGDTWKSKGLKGFYPGGTAIAFRQATNWASRVGFTEMVRVRMKRWKYNDETVKLSVLEESTCGVIGGAISCWNHPFEVARIEMQARGIQGQKSMNMIQVFSMVVKEHGPLGLFKGVVPRIGLGIWQTLFMVSFANIIRERFL